MYADLTGAATRDALEISTISAWLYYRTNDHLAVNPTPVASRAGSYTLLAHAVTIANALLSKPKAILRTESIASLK